MKIQVRAVVALACVVGLSAANVAQAEVQDRAVAVSGSPEAQYAQIVAAATAMCAEAAAQGEVFDVRRCVKLVVAQTIAEMDRPELLRIAQTQ